MKSRFLRLFALLAFSFSLGAGAARADDADAKHKKIEADSGQVLTRLYASTPGSRELVANSSGLLVFPSVLSAGETTGGQYGEGTLLVAGKAVAFYSATGTNLATQHGEKSRAIVILFLTQDALDRFKSSKEWTAGVDAAAAALKRTSSGSIDTKMGSTPVIGFAVTAAGVMFDASIEGTKIRPLK